MICAFQPLSHEMWYAQLSPHSRITDLLTIWGLFCVPTTLAWGSKPQWSFLSLFKISLELSISYLTFNFYLHLSTHSLFVSSFNASHTVYINNPVGSSHLFSFLFVNIGRSPVIILFFILAQFLSESLNLYLYVCSLSKMRKF